MEFGLLPITPITINVYSVIVLSTRVKIRVVLSVLIVWSSCLTATVKGRVYHIGKCVHICGTRYVRYKPRKVHRGSKITRKLRIEMEYKEVVRRRKRENTRKKRRTNTDKDKRYTRTYMVG